MKLSLWWHCGSSVLFTNQSTLMNLWHIKSNSTSTFFMSSHLGTVRNYRYFSRNKKSSKVGGSVKAGFELRSRLISCSMEVDRRRAGEHVHDITLCTCTSIAPTHDTPATLLPETRVIVHYVVNINRLHLRAGSISKASRVHAKHAKRLPAPAGHTRNINLRFLSRVQSGKPRIMRIVTVQRPTANWCWCELVCSSRWSNRLFSGKGYRGELFSKIK